ncbi:glycoside hydrolase family 5 protein [Acetobacter estunensis]|uniref:glycoside hydrolase family 5 protein n=1 Tax=Acetobacter estunensis TaxID=104097 RepID=UPI001C2D6D8E|nr:glycoside hydrolase family 5 protein [Acetobacter estunensis]MBV1837483.1 glycoside hydrolase family 5 protein [Acetobacter estunensis]
MRLHDILALVALGGLTLGTTAAEAATPRGGVNLAGAGFASGKIPGRLNWDYMFPKQGEIDYYTQQGMSLFRLPILWERIQPQLSGKLDVAYLREVKDFIEASRKAGAEVILDVHNYGKFHGKFIGTSDVPTAAFVDLWVRLGREFGRDRHVLFDLMNEPQQSSADEWVDIQQAVIDGLRKAGVKNRIIVSGVKWDGAHNFEKDNGAALARLHDPVQPLLYQAHQYFDADSSGRSPNCIPQDQVVGKLSPFVDWLKAHHAQGILGEFGVSQTPECLADLKAAMTYLYAQPDVIYGWTYWAGGPLWGAYMYSIEPTKDGTEKPQMDVLRPFLATKRHAGSRRHSAP